MPRGRELAAEAEELLGGGKSARLVLLSATEDVAELSPPPRSDSYVAALQEVAELQREAQRLASPLWSPHQEQSEPVPEATTEDGERLHSTVSPQSRPPAASAAPPSGRSREQNEGGWSAAEVTGSAALEHLELLGGSVEGNAARKADMAAAALAALCIVEDGGGQLSAAEQRRSLDVDAELTTMRDEVAALRRGAKAASSVADGGALAAQLLLAQAKEQALGGRVEAAATAATAGSPPPSPLAVRRPPSSPTSPGPQLSTDVRKTFEAFDADGSGYLDESEIGKFCQKIGLLLSREEVKLALDEMETEATRDGKVEFDEFLCAIHLLSPFSLTSAPR